MMFVVVYMMNCASEGWICLGGTLKSLDATIREDSTGFAGVKLQKPRHSYWNDRKNGRK